MFVFKKYISFPLLLIAIFFISFQDFAFSQTITQTKNVSVSAQVGSLPVIDAGGGGGGGVINYQSGVRFSGVAYPNGTVIVQKGLEKIVSVKTDITGAFNILVGETNPSLFTIFALDSVGRQSTLLNFPTVFYNGYLTDITGIKFAPTIVTDKIAVKNGDFLSIEGGAIQNSNIEIVIKGTTDIKFSLVSDNLGNYKITVPINVPNGEYIVMSRYAGDARSSRAIRISIGVANIFESEVQNNVPGDCNFDQHVTLSDFSILAYWFGKDNPPKCVDTNNDGVIDLIDFSILAFYWNG